MQAALYRGMGTTLQEDAAQADALHQVIQALDAAEGAEAGLVADGCGNSLGGGAMSAAQWSSSWSAMVAGNGGSSGSGGSNGNGGSNGSRSNSAAGATKAARGSGSHGSTTGGAGDEAGSTGSSVPGTKSSAVTSGTNGIGSSSAMSSVFGAIDMCQPGAPGPRASAEQLLLALRFRMAVKRALERSLQAVLARSKHLKGPAAATAPK